MENRPTISPILIKDRNNLGIEATLLEMESFQGSHAAFLRQYISTFPDIFSHLFENNPTDAQFETFTKKALPPLITYGKHAAPRPTLVQLRDYLPRMTELLQGATSLPQAIGSFQTMIQMSAMPYDIKTQKYIRAHLNRSMFDEALSEYFVATLPEHILTDNIETPQFTKSLECFDYFLSRCGVLQKRTNFFRWWFNMGYKKPINSGEEHEVDESLIPDSFRDSLRTMAQVEAAKPGYVKRLVDEYNIHSFGRYDSGQLIKQLESGQDPRETFLVTVSNWDYNGSFRNLKWLKGFAEHLETEGVALRVYEIDNNQSLLRAYLREGRKNSNPSLIGSLHLSHGNIYGASFHPDYDNVNHHLATYNTSPELIQKIRTKHYVQDNPLMILGYCESDGEFGQLITESTDMQIIRFPKSVYNCTMDLVTGNSGTESAKRAYKIKYKEEFKGEEQEIVI